MSDPFVGKQLGDYVIQSLLGRGGMARVYKGYDERLQRFAAVKIINTDLVSADQEEYTERFRREARAIARLNHPNIVGVYQFGDYEGHYYMAMVFVEGKDLRQILREYHERNEHIPHHMVLNIVQGIGNALDYAHNRGVIHRDIKPSNIMINADNQPVLTDFGLALSAWEGTLGDTFGSAHYIAPEQAVSSANAVPQSDLYSLGICTYEMLVGKVPFDDPSAMSVALKHLNEPPPSLRDFVPDLPEAVERVVLKALEKDPEQRYRTGAELAHALAIGMVGGETFRLPRPQVIRSGMKAPKTPDQEESDTVAAEAEPAGPAGVLVAEVPPALRAEADRGASREATQPDGRPTKGRGNRSGVLLLSLAALLAVGGAIALLSGGILGSGQQGTPGQTATIALTGTLLAAMNTMPGTESATATLPAAQVTTSTPLHPEESVTSIPSDMPSRTSTPTATASATITNTYTATSTLTPIPTNTPVPSRTSTPTRTPIVASTAIPAATPTPLAAALITQTAQARPDILLVYNDEQLNLINVSSRTLDVSDLEFVQHRERVDRQFKSIQWQVRGAYYPPEALPPRWCFQLGRLDVGLVNTFLQCRSRSAYVLTWTQSWFWFADEASGTFDVLLGGEVLKTCRIEAGSCSFKLP